MSAVQDLFQLDWQSSIIWFFGIIGFVVFAVNLIKQFCNIFGIRLAFLDKNKQVHQDIKDLKQSISKLNLRFDTLETMYEEHGSIKSDLNQLLVTLNSVQKENNELKNGMYQVVGNAAENRIRFYNQQGYILEAEYDSFCDFLDYAIKVMHCNHGLERKYIECKNTLPMLSPEEAIQFEEDKKEVKS